MPLAKPGKGLREGCIEDFSGSHAAAAKRPPGKLSEREARVFSRQRSEDVQGRKIFSIPAKRRSPEKMGDVPL
ncbi:MAG: hypothetical protein LLG97_01635 [Deltaproteobacteria bacterium]|nr:hypothetical protein [Deltaproteobacteria bacterium]